MKKTAMVWAFFLTFIGSLSAAGSPRIPIIFDTDIGSDIDDAFALALIVNCPELELLGVTTVSGDAEGRARLAAKILWDAGGGWRKVPVVAGEQGPPQPIEQTRWAAGFTSPQIRKEKAVDFLRRLIQQRPGEITLVPVGEFTNIAALLKADPTVAQKIKGIVLMGGSIEYVDPKTSKLKAEWNIRSNPAAAQVVFSSGIPIIMAPLDVTAMLQLDAAGRHRVFTRLTPLTNALTLLYHLWNRETPTLFDPMAIAMLLDPTMCQTEQVAIEVDAQGFTRVATGKPANVTVGMHSDPAKFFQFYLSRVAP